MIANYRVQNELSSVESTHDGTAVILGTVDGCVSVLAINDPDKPDMAKFLSEMPSRDENVSFRNLVSIVVLKKKFFLVENEDGKNENTNEIPSCGDNCEDVAEILPSASRRGGKWS